MLFKLLVLKKLDLYFSDLCEGPPDVSGTPLGQAEAPLTAAGITVESNHGFSGTKPKYHH